jgi:hypothetical protein
MFNINDHVRVKLTSTGLKEFAERADAWNAAFPSIPIPREPELTEDGYYETQLWSLMHDFGHVVRFGTEPPFETVIFLEVRS